MAITSEPVLYWIIGNKKEINCSPFAGNLFLWLLDLVWLEVLGCGEDALRQSSAHALPSHTPTNQKVLF